MHVSLLRTHRAVRRTLFLLKFPALQELVVCRFGGYVGSGSHKLTVYRSNEFNQHVYDGRLMTLCPFIGISHVCRCAQ